MVSYHETFYKLLDKSDKVNLEWCRMVQSSHIFHKEFIENEVVMKPVKIADRIVLKVLSDLLGWDDGSFYYETLLKLLVM